MRMIRDLWYSVCTTCRPNTSRTVRYAFPIIALAILASGVAQVISNQTSYITIEAYPQSMVAGDPFYIDVIAVAATPVNAIDIVLEYPADRIDISRVDVGQSVITLWTEDPYAKDGKIYMRGGTYRKGFVGEHLIAKIRGVARESGSAVVATNNVTFIAGDGQGTEVLVTDSTESTVKLFIQNKDGTLSGSAELELVTDIDGDGKVTLSDISVFMSAWFDKSRFFDFNGDGRMTFRDFSIILADSFLR